MRSNSERKGSGGKKEGGEREEVGVGGMTAEDNAGSSCGVREH